MVPAYRQLSHKSEALVSGAAPASCRSARTPFSPPVEGKHTGGEEFFSWLIGCLFSQQQHFQQQEEEIEVCVL